MFPSPGNDWRGWIKEQKQEHGKIKYFTDEAGERIWKITGN